VVPGALEHVADRVSHLVYLDAFVPADGQSLDDLPGAGYRPGAVGPGATWLGGPLQRTIEDAGAAHGPPAEHAKTSPDWRYLEVDGDHMIPMNRPADLVALLLELT